MQRGKNSIVNGRLTVAQSISDRATLYNRTSTEATRKCDMWNKFFLASFVSYSLSDRSSAIGVRSAAAKQIGKKAARTTETEAVA